MGLPEGSTSAPWPPKPFDTAQDQFQLWNAWFSNDTDALYEWYSQPGAHARPSQYAGGIVGRVARFFWGRPMQQASKRIHVPAASDIARTGADLLFSQPPQWVLSESDVKGGKAQFEAAQKRLEVLLESSDVNATLLEAAEIQAALGGVYLRLWWDQDVTRKVMLSAVGADGAIPEWRYGQLAAVTFWTEWKDEKSGVWRHLERHSPGFIEHGLYKGETDTLGRLMPLTDRTETEWAADLVDSDGRIPTGVKGLTAAYVPNVRPSRMWRSIPGLSLLGRSDYDGLEPLFDALDEAWTSWMRDIDHGKSRLFVDAEALEDNGPGRGASFDPEQPVYTPVPRPGLGDDPTRSLVEAQQFTIRYAEHHATVKDLMTRILVGAGYSVSDFGDDEMSSAVTATEINARKDLSNRTRSKKIGYWRSGMEELARTMLELDAVVYADERETPFEVVANPEMKFPVRQDQTPVQVAEMVARWFDSGSASTETRVRTIWPNWSNDQVQEELERIKDDRKLDGMPSEFDAPTFGGGTDAAEFEPPTRPEGDMGADGEELDGE